MTTPDSTLITAFVEALSHRDRSRLSSLMGPDVRMRASLPSRDVGASGPAAVVSELLDWFSDVSGLGVLGVQVDLVGDVWHAGYSFALHGDDVERVVQQHAYCTTRDGSIATLRLVCSGFRPASMPSAIVDASAGSADGSLPMETVRIDALGEGCATLTPRIAAAMGELAPGEVLSVLADDPSAPADISSWSRLTGHTIVASADEERGTRIYVRHS